MVTLNAIIDSILGLVIALLVVSRVVRKQWTSWLQSKEADPYLDRVGERVVAKLPSMPKVPTTEDFMEAIEPRLQGFEDVINKPLDLDLGPITREVIDEVSKIRSQIEGHLGFLKKVGKNVGEAVVEEAGNEALQNAGIDPHGGQAVLMKKLGLLLQDEKWVTEHRAAAIGLEALQAEMKSAAGQGTLLSKSSSSGGLLRKRR